MEFAGVLKVLQAFERIASRALENSLKTPSFPVCRGLR